MEKIKSLMISDLHLGNHNSQANKVLELFKKYEFENLFIIGDFIDLTALKRKFYWNENHSTVIQKVLRLSRKNINIVYVLGNHDYYLRGLIEEGNINIGNILICDEHFYTTVKGEKIWMTHGDCFDGIVKTNPFLYWLGDNAYEFSIKLNKVFNFFRRIFGLEYWSLSSYLKKKVKNVVKFLADYKKIAIVKMNEKNITSILQGHTHSPEISKVDNYNFYNTGDFVESSSYIIENLNGELELKYI